mmetsp:Transcript_46664/g.135044  ORF Transcript_46664/g.135044 Transcript_46664/m.135044 type:complete len:482 (-) Transcript_46664:89-1534(-)
MVARFIWCSLLLLPFGHSQLLDEASLVQLSKLLRTASQDPEVEHFWSSRGGGPATRSSVDFPAPNISRVPSWVWENELHEQVRHSPLIDADKNIYLATTTRLRKLDSNGTLLWMLHWGVEDAAMSAAPALYQGDIYTITRGRGQAPTVASIATKTGAINWLQTFGNMTHNGDAQSLSVYNGTIFFGIGREGDGTDAVVALRASDGTYLWDYQTDETMWNFSPSTPGDGTLLFASSCGAVFRLSAEGKLLWRAGKGKPTKAAKPEMCVPGGGALGPNGVFYVESSQASGIHGEDGTLAAYNVGDGSLLWERALPLRAAQYPAVGRLGKNGPLAVVAGLGDNPMPVMPNEINAAIVSKQGPWRNSVLAVDAMTGDTLWRYDAPPYHSTFGAGETDVHNATDGEMCWPDAQGIPLITGDGTVYASSSLGGELRQIRDEDGDGLISPSEVTVFETNKCFLNSPSVAPGMLVAAPCWGPMYVFKES